MQDIIPPPRPKYKPISGRAAARTSAPQPPVAKPDAESAADAHNPIKQIEKEAQIEEESKPKLDKSKLPVLKEEKPTDSAVGGKIKPPWYRRLLTWFLVVATLLCLGSLNVAAWANRTILSRNTFVGTFAPLADNAKVQDEVADKLTDKILDSASPQEFATKLLPTVDPATPDDKLRSQLHPVIKESVLKAVKSAHFGAAWRQALGSVHDSVISKVAAGNTKDLTINFKPVLNDVLDSLKGTQLAFIADEHREEVLKGDSSNVKLDDEQSIQNINKAIDGLKKAPVYFLAASLVVFLLAVLISPYRFKTVRKIVLWASIELLILGGGFMLTKSMFGKLGPNDARELLSNIIPQILHGLIQQSIILGIAGLVGWFILYLLHRTKLSRIS